MTAYDAATDRRPGHITRLQSECRNGAWGSCSCGWTSPIGLMGEAVAAITAHLDDQPALLDHADDVPPPTPGSAQALWEQAKREFPLTEDQQTSGVMLSKAQSDRFRQLMREHGKPVFADLLMDACGVPEDQQAYVRGEVDHPDESRWQPQGDAS